MNISTKSVLFLFAVYFVSFVALVVLPAGAA